MRELRFARLATIAVAVFAGDPGPGPGAAPIRSEPLPSAALSAAPTAARPGARGALQAEASPGKGAARMLHLASGNEAYLSRPNAWVYVPRGFDPAARTLHVAVLFHGFKNCLESYVTAGGRVCTPGQDVRTGYDIAAQVERSGTSAIVVVPQLAYDATHGDATLPIAKIGGLRAFLTELLERAIPDEIGQHRYEDVDRVGLLASSGGYEALLPAMLLGGVERIRDVYLLDAFYIETRTHEEFLRDHLADFAPDAPDPRRFGMVFGQKSGTAAQSRRFGFRVAGWMLEAGQGAYAAYEPRMRAPTLDDLRVPVAILAANLEHDQVVNEYLWRFLAASGI